MNTYRAFRSVGLIIFGLLHVLAGLLLCATLVWHQYSTESDYRHRYGQEWREQYEQNIGSLEQAHTKTGVAVFGLIAIPGIFIWLVRILTAKDHRKSGSNVRTDRQREGSLEERAARYRRNAVVGIYFGSGGILVGIAQVLVRFHIFANHDMEVLLGGLVFLFGYAGCISGCWWWLKAKGWTEAVVFIALMPVAACCFRVNLIFLVSPMIVAMAMTMMTVILIVVVAILPDKSGIRKRRSSRMRSQ